MAWVPALKVFFALVFVYGVLPRILFPPPRTARGTLDRFVIDLIRTSAFLIAVAHVLSVLRLFQWTGLIIVFSAWVYLVRLRPAGYTPSGILRWGYDKALIVLYLVEACSREGNETVKAAVRTWWHSQVRSRLRVRLGGGRKAVILVLVVPLVAVIGGSLAVRLAYPIAHAALISSDSYVHLVWLKYLAGGQIFRDGLYPHGMHSVLAVAETLSPASTFDMIRFAGAFLNTLLVFLVYLLSLRVTRHAGAALGATAVIGLIGIRPEVGLSGLRQAATLPQEFGVLFALAGVLMLLEHIARPSRERLVYVLLAAFVAVMSHNISAAVVLVGSGFAGIAVALRSPRPFLAFVRPPVAAVAGTALGMLYLPLGLLAGVPLYGAVNKLNPLENAQGAAAAASTVGHTLGGGLLPLALAGAAVGLAYGVVRLHRDRTQALVTIAAAAFILACVAVPRSGLLYSWYAIRWAEMVVPLLPVGLALGLVPLRHLAPRASIARAGVAVTVGLAIVVATVVVLPPRPARTHDSQIEYEAAARVVGQTIKDNPKLAFTVVGPPPWFARVLGAGFHVHLIDVADRLTEADAMDPAFEFPVGTELVFVLTEKQPFLFGARTRIQDRVIRRYYDEEHRRALMEDIEGWMRAYSRFRNGVSVLYDDENVRVWKIEQPANFEHSKRFPLVPDRR